MTDSHLFNASETATLTHGYTMADIARAARIATRRHTFSAMWLSEDDRLQEAWDGIIELLYECGCGWGTCARTEPLRFPDLIYAAFQQLGSATHAQEHHHGLRGNGDEAPNFIKFWLPVKRLPFSGDGFSDYMCERLALPDALAVLTDLEYEAIAALAAHGDLGKAADALGITYSAFHSRVATARKRIAAVWFEHETPPGPKKRPTVDTCLSGHDRAKHGVQRQTKQGLKWRCNKCERMAWHRRKTKAVAAA